MRNIRFGWTAAIVCIVAWACFGLTWTASGRSGSATGYQLHMWFWPTLLLAIFSFMWLGVLSLRSFTPVSTLVSGVVAGASCGLGSGLGSLVAKLLVSGLSDDPAPVMLPVLGVLLSFPVAGALVLFGYIGSRMPWAGKRGKPDPLSPRHHASSIVRSVALASVLVGLSMQAFPKEAPKANPAWLLMQRLAQARRSAEMNKQTFDPSRVSVQDLPPVSDPFAEMGAAYFGPHRSVAMLARNSALAVGGLLWLGLAASMVLRRPDRRLSRSAPPRGGGEEV
jgi:hypothetical protein